jgi:hypothetical protein
MATDRSIYVIDPEQTDPELVRSLTALGDGPDTTEAPRTSDHSPRAPSPPTRTTAAAPKLAAAARRPKPTRPIAGHHAPERPAPPRPPRHPGRALVAAHLLGPWSPLLTPANRRRRPWRLAGAAAAVGIPLAAWAGASAATWLGPGDRAMLLQLVIAGLTAALSLAAWGAGILAAARWCGEGPLARRDRRRPVLAMLAGFAAPGLGLLLAGHRWRALIATVLVGAGLLAAAVLWQIPTWWRWHVADIQPVIPDLRVEQGVIVAALVLAAGLIAWLVSALEAGRLAAGRRVVRDVGSADRAPAGLLVALLALGAFFRPGDLAAELDGATSALAAREFRLLPVVTAWAATRLDPADPRLTWNLAARYEVLGEVAQAARIRQELDERWQQYARTGATATAADADPTDPPAASPAAAAAAVRIAHPLAAASAVHDPPPSR